MIALDRVRKPPFVLLYEITDPWETAAVFDQLGRFGNDIRKVPLTRNINKRGSYVIVGGKKLRAPGYSALHGWDPVSSVKNFILDASFFLCKMISERRLCLFEWWI